MDQKQTGVATPVPSWAVAGAAQMDRRRRVRRQRVGLLNTKARVAEARNAEAQRRKERRVK
jgi:hypothetical protein